jgi:catecholate siderophore receptor
MAHIRSRKHEQAALPLIKPSFVAPSLLALGALTTPLSSHAQQAGSAAETLPEVKVKAAATSEPPPYKVDKAASPKLTQPLLDTPQTITVIPAEVIKERGATTLTEALRNTPGITLQLGENGSTSAGDTFQMRGVSSQSSILVDGVRDMGAITRDTFNIEQIDVVKGPAGADAGRGTPSGYINLSSKLPKLENLSGATATINSADNKRVTADLNRKIGDNAAVRLNVMGQGGGVPGRDGVENNSWGIAPSVAFGLNTPTRLYLFSQHIRQDNVPDGGVPTIGLKGYYNANGTIAGGRKVDSSNYYGSDNDYERVSADMFTAKVEHDWAPGSTVRNITRYGTTTMDRILTALNTNNTGIAAPSSDPATWTITRTRQGVDQVNEIFTNQTSVNTTFDTAGLKHSFVGGLEVTYERQKTSTFSSTGLTIPVANLYNPNSDVSLPLPYKTGAYTDGNTFTVSPYVSDMLELNKFWQVDAGIRVDKYQTKTTAVTATQNSTTGVVTALTPGSAQKDGDLLSWKVGSVYKPVDYASVYASLGNSQTPPGGNAFSLSTTTNANSTNNPAFDPQEAQNIELGTKWDVLDRRLGLTAALYRTTIKNEISLLDSATNTYGAFGKRRVQGIELGAAGDLTDKWHLQAGLQTMNTKVQQGTTGNNAEGAATRWSPKLTATAWTTYDLPAGWQVGGGVSYVSKQKRVVDPSAALATSPVPVVPSYTVMDAMVSYEATKNVKLRMNVYNLFDKDYALNVNNAGSRYTPGAPRYVALTAEFLY